MRNAIIWGNHSANLVPDITHATCRGQAITLDPSWVYDEWVPWVQKRGASVIAQRGASSAASAAYALCEHIRHLRMIDSPVFSLGVHSTGEYGSLAGTWVSLPHQLKNGKRVLIDHIVHDEKMKTMLQISFDELALERKICLEMSLI